MLRSSNCFVNYKCQIDVTRCTRAYWIPPFPRVFVNTAYRVAAADGGTESRKKSYRVVQTAVPSAATSPGDGNDPPEESSRLRDSQDCIIQGWTGRTFARRRRSLIYARIYTHRATGRPLTARRKNNFETALPDIRASERASERKREKERRKRKRRRARDGYERGARKVFCLWQPRSLQPRTSHPARSTNPFHSCLKPR